MKGSNKKISANEKTIINGIECIFFPEEEGNKKYAILLENLKIRKEPSTKDEVNNFDGWRYFGWIYGGYVKIIEQHEVEKYEKEYKKLLIKKLQEAGAEMN